MEAFQAFLTAIPDAAKSPYSLAAFALTITAWVAISFRVSRNKNLLEHIKDLPEADRLPALTGEVGHGIPPNLSAEQWLASQRTKYIATGALLLIASITLVIVLALYWRRDSGPPQPPTKFSQLKSADIQVSAVDDFMTVSVNNTNVEDAKYGETPPWRPILKNLKPGPNKVEVIITNGQYGGCGGNLAIRLNGVVFDQLKHEWAVPQDKAGVNTICVQQVLTLDFD